MRLSNEQLEFLARLNKAPEGRLLLTLLQAKLRECEANLRTKTGEEVYRAQGRALELDELIADITEAQARLTRTVRPPTSRVPYGAHQPIPS
jgi:hypothetical protein